MPNKSPLTSSTTCKVACDDEIIKSTYKVNDPETDPPATKPEPKPTDSPTVSEEISKEPPSVVIILEAMSASFEPWVMVNVKSDVLP